MTDREIFELYHYGVKGMHWGIRRYQNPDGTLTELGKKRSLSERANDAIGNLLGTENEKMNKLTKSSGKLRKAYFDMQRSGVKYKNGEYKFTDKSNTEKYKRQRSAYQRSKKAVNDYLEKYGDQPITYSQSRNAQTGAIVGAAVAAGLPIVGVWATVPLGYYVGSKFGVEKPKQK